MIVAERQPLLEIAGLTVRYKHGRHGGVEAVRDVDLTIDRGEVLSLVGESGSGKSTIGNAILGLVAPASGSIRFAGQEITALPPRERRRLTRQIQAIFQDPKGSFNPTRTVGQTLEEPMLAHETRTRRERRAAVAAALERVGLDPGDARQYPARFSGGQLQRLAIARALMLSPDLLICDEAVSALDLSVQAQILNLLRRMRAELGLSMLFISHDLSVVRHVSDRVAVIYRGQLIETGRVTEVCDNPRHPYTQALLASAPVPDPVEQRIRRTEREAARA